MEKKITHAIFFEYAIIQTFLLGNNKNLLFAIYRIQVLFQIGVLSGTTLAMEKMSKVALVSVTPILGGYWWDVRQFKTDYVRLVEWIVLDNKQFLQ